SGGLRLPVERRGGYGQLNRMSLCLPVARARGGAPGGEADVDAALGGTGLSRGVGDVRRDAETERGLVLLRDGGIGPGDEFDFERAIGFGGGRAMRDLLAGLDLRPPPRIPAPPGGPAHLAHDAIPELCAVDRR